MENQRNLIMAVVLCALLLFGWDAAVSYFYPHANKPVVAASPTPAAQSGEKPSRDGGLLSAADRAAEARDLKTALATPGRIAIAAPGLSGSINPAGALLDDLVTNRHQNQERNGAERIFSPVGTPAEHYAQIGWDGQNVELPGPNTVWTAPAGAKLTPETPVTLTWTNAAGMAFAITYKIDKDYMISADASVANRGAAPVTVTPFARLGRTSKTASLDTWNIHSGPFGAFDEKVSFDADYEDLAELPGGLQVNEGKANWIGFTDIYWMSALIPGKETASTNYRSLGGQLFQANMFYKPVAVAPGQSAGVSTRLFAGAKEGDVLAAYEKTGIAKFSLAIDWGWFRWFEEPIFWLLKKLFSLAGNFGVAIILLTLIVRGIMFPIAQRQFTSMAAMKAIQPKMKALQERYKDDKQKLQEETLKLYKSEGVNPLGGCLPIFLQIPVFFALYKVLTLAVEMRHQPFALWIKDLSAPDPLHVLNLFGLLPFEVPGFLGIGVLAILLGVTMWAQFKLNPASPDPVQQQVFAIMPWMMMFIMAPFAAGLLIYWITSNLLTILQQWYLYSKHPQMRAMVEKERADVLAAKKNKQ
ncbi:membrane protein insertase YidC [Novosphingobium sp. TH158]|uniref:membrane protein insertase YidC n=1 Tax=Novosphingobium sp. TH158 TaxID=2067455 RepID=UPI000C7CBE34|nr:membrane protein insertase YidC [Novosphingobium sp. TH158]PLK24216.1 membrane protein insertase YidC [Novosphingobium sp. TH158]